MKQAILVIGLIAAFLVLNWPVSGITIEYFWGDSEAEPHTNFVRHTETYVNNDALKAEIEAEASGTWAELEDWEKVWELTKFTRKHAIRYGTSDKTTNWDPAINNSSLYHEFTDMANNDHGYACLGFAALLMHLCGIYDIDAYAICGGANTGPSGYWWTHSTVLAMVEIDGHIKAIHYDPYFGDMYTYENGTPMSFFVMQDHIEADEFDEIYRKSIGYKYDLFSVSNTSFEGDYYSTTYLIETMISEAGGTRVWRDNNFFIAPYCQETEDRGGEHPEWGPYYDNPYELWETAEIYDVFDFAHVDVGQAHVEAEET